MNQSLNINSELFVHPPRNSASFELESGSVGSTKPVFPLSSLLEPPQLLIYTNGSYRNEDRDGPAGRKCRSS
jgi:hypothetical protein